MKLQGKVAVVTGASGGIGSATAHRLAEAGCMVLVGYNSRADAAEKVVAALPGSGHRTARMPMEDTAVLREVAAMVEREYGRCDVLVNSAGFTRMIPHADLEALTDELIDAIFVANVRGPFATIRAFAPLMKRSDAAVIINISSAAALSGGGSNIAYGASKAAIDAMTQVAGAGAGAEHSRAVGVAWRGGYRLRARPHDRDGGAGSATHAAEARGSGRRSGADGDGRGHP